MIIHLVAAARPNFMKIGPLHAVLAKESWCQTHIVHTGQHYDANMSDAIFRDLGLPPPRISLGIGSGSHAEQTGRVMIAYEKVCQETRPDVVVVVGDVNSTPACALVGTKLHIPVVHLEAGLRSRDRRMPEEINRLVTDSISDLLWTPSPDADQNLIAEGVPKERIEFVGNIMIDSYEMVRPRIEADDTLSQLGVVPRQFVLVTLHRPSNVDDRATLALLVRHLLDLATQVTLVFALHPRTRKRLEDFGLLQALRSSASVRLTEPLGYISFMSLLRHARAIVTDSGGVQEESTYLGVPCLTLRENTERPITVTLGTNRLVKPADLPARFRQVLAGDWPAGQRPERWDGHTAERCAASLHDRYG